MVKVTWRGTEAKAQMARGKRAALKDAAEFLLEQANRTVPIEEDTLERSGKATVLDDDHAAVSYDTPYARRQHEDLTLHHAPGRRAKWLQRSLTEQAGSITEVIARKLREVNGL